MDRKDLDKLQPIEIDNLIKELSISKAIKLDEQFASKDVGEIMKAVDYVSNQKKNKTTDFKAYLFSPDNEFYAGTGYKNSFKSLSFPVLRRMGRVPAVRTVIGTRQNQVMNFSKFTSDLQREGWTIRLKPGRFDSEDKKLTEKDKKRIDELATFLENGGFGDSKWDFNSDDLDDFLKKQVQDSLELDQACFYIGRDRQHKIHNYVSVDSATIRLLENIDPANRYQSEYQDVLNGFVPAYAQVWNGKIVQKQISEGYFEPMVYYPWEMSFGVRNKTSNILNNGYGISELEILIEVVTWIMNGMQYNGNFFKQGSNPKGFFNIKSGADSGVLNEFKKAWTHQVVGVDGSHRIPVFQGDEVQWIDMHHSNKDMEFQNWNEFLILLTCAVMSMDPSEVGLTFKNQNAMFGQDGQKQRLQWSKDKGLKPLLQFLQKQINKYLISELDPRFEFVFTGVDIEDEASILDNDVKKVTNGGMSMQDFFKKYSGRDFEEGKDIILNQVYLQIQQMSQFGGQESNQAVDEMTGEPGEGVQNPFDQYEKALDSSPIVSEMTKLINETFKV